MEISSVSDTLLNASETSTDVTWSATADGTYEVRVGGTSCTTGTVIEGPADYVGPGEVVSSIGAAALAEGANTLRVCVTDVAVETASATTTVNRDTVAPPAPAVTGTAPASPANDNVPAIQGSAEAASIVSLHATVDCSGAVAAAGAAEVFSAAGIVASVADDTTTTFSATATDAAGNTSACSASTVDYIEDSTAPETTITSGPGAITNETSATFEFVSSEPGSTFQCSLDSGPLTACSSPQTYVGLSDGGHQLQVAATDVAGNVDPTVDSLLWTIDTSIPQTQLDTAPQGLTNSSSATFSFSSPTASASFQCSLDAGDFSSCSSPLTLTGLSDDQHVFFVRAVSAVGAPDPTPPNAIWTVDTVAPETTITGWLVRSSSTSVTFVSSEGGSAFQCSLDGGPFAACSSPAAFSGLLDGSHGISVRATDPAGNVESSPATASWTVDAVPETTITAGPDSPTDDTTAVFSFSSTDPTATFVCTVDDLAPFACRSPLTITGAGPGAHAFQVIAIDGGGQSDPTPATWTWDVGATSRPSKLRKVKSTTTNRTVTLKWARPNDPNFDHVEIVRSVIGKRSSQTKLVYRGSKRQHRDRGLRQGIEYRYVLYAVSRTGIRSRRVIVKATPGSLRLVNGTGRAKAGSRLKLTWVGVRKARFYNVQLFRGSTKVLSIWPTKPQVKLGKRWQFEGRTHTLSRGLYTWIVWPALGTRSNLEFGKRLGQSRFTVKRK